MASYAPPVVPNVAVRVPSADLPDGTRPLRQTAYHRTTLADVRYYEVSETLLDLFAAASSTSRPLNRFQEALATVTMAAPNNTARQREERGGALADYFRTVRFLIDITETRSNAWAWVDSFLAEDWAMPPFPDARRGPRSLWINAIIVDTMVTSSLVRHLPQDLFALFCLALAIVCGAQEMAHLAGQAIRHGRAPDWHRGVAPPVNVNGASSSARAEAVAAEMRHGEAGAALEQRLFGGQMHVRYRTLGEWEEMSLESADGIELHVRQGSSVRRYDVDMPYLRWIVEMLFLYTSPPQLQERVAPSPYLARASATRPVPIVPESLNPPETAQASGSPSDPARPPTPPSPPPERPTPSALGVTSTGLGRGLCM